MGGRAYPTVLGVEHCCYTELPWCMRIDLLFLSLECNATCDLADFLMTTACPHNWPETCLLILALRVSKLPFSLLLQVPLAVDTRSKRHRKLEKSMVSRPYMCVYTADYKQVARVVDDNWFRDCMYSYASRHSCTKDVVKLIVFVCLFQL